jgi:hypothetical protein
MVEKPIVFLPLVWMFVLNAFPQLLQNLTVKPTIDGLTIGCRKNDQHGIDIVANFTLYFQPR